MVKVIFVNDIATARAFENILIWIFRSKDLINETYISPEPALLPLTVQLLSQLDNPTMGCQVWLDASEIRPFNCGLVLPPEIQRRFTRNILEVPIGIFKVKLLYRKGRSERKMRELQEIQMSLIGDFNVELAVPEPEDILPEIPLLDTEQEPDTETRPLGDRIFKLQKSVSRTRGPNISQLKMHERYSESDARRLLEAKSQLPQVMEKREQKPPGS